MLKPADLKNRTIKKNLGGYSAAEMDAFLEEISRDYEKLYSDNAEMALKIEKLAKVVASYKKNEEAIRVAVDNVKLLCESLIQEANKKSEDIIESTLKKRDEILQSLEKTIKEKKNEIKKLNDEITEYKEKLIFHYKIHYESITKLPVFKQIDDKAIADAESEIKKLKDEEVSIPILMNDNADDSGEPVLEGASPNENKENDEIYIKNEDIEGIDETGKADYIKDNLQNIEDMDNIQKETKKFNFIFDDDLQFGEEYRVHDFDGRGQGLFHKKK